MFYNLFLENFIVLKYYMYVSICLGFGGNWICLSFNEIEFDFVI
jgi:hypothetical protein